MKAMNMKICIINNLYPPYSRGGAEQVVTKTVQGLAKEGHEVVVITTVPAGGTEIFEEEVSPRIHIYRFTPKNIYFYTEGYRYSWPVRLLWHVIDMFNYQSVRYISHILRAERPDIVHTHNLMGVGFLTPMVVKKQGIPLFHTLHDVQLVEPSGIIKKRRENTWRYTGLPTKLYAALMRRLMGVPETIISPSKFLLEFYRKWGFFAGSERILLRNPVRSVDPGSVVPSTRLRLLYLGQIEDHKGIEFLVSSLRSFLNIHPDVTLTIAGDGSRIEALRMQTDDIPNIRIIGKISHDDLGRLFAETDLTVVPSLCYENSPTVIFESFSYGVPVLASRVEGVEELITEGENGFLFTTEDGQALVGVLTEHLTDIKGLRGKSMASIEGLSESAYIGHLLRAYTRRKK